MSRKRIKIIIVLIIVTLIIITISLITAFNIRRTKEVKVSKEFIQLLYDNNIIEKNDNSKNIKYNIEKINDGDKQYYRVSSNLYGIDLNSDYNVIGFNNNIPQKTALNDIISPEDARNKAEEYISNLVKDKFKFKELIDPGVKEESYYSFRFTRYMNGYPFYNDTIIINIDKYSGYLSSFSNTSSQGNPIDIEINISSEEAENEALNLFNSTNQNGNITIITKESNNQTDLVNKSSLDIKEGGDETYKVYYNNREQGATELCYVVTISGKDSDDKDIKIKYFVSTETGKVINEIRDTVSNTIIIGDK